MTRMPLEMRKVWARPPFRVMRGKTLGDTVNVQDVVAVEFSQSLTVRDTVYWPGCKWAKLFSPREHGWDSVWVGWWAA